MSINETWDCGICKYFEADDRQWLCSNSKRWKEEILTRSNINGWTIAINEGNCRYLAKKNADT